MANGVELNTSSGSSASPDKTASAANQSVKETIDFLHFIRYMNVIYKSDINIRLKFLYGVSLKNTKSRISIYNNIFSVLNSRLYNPRNTGSESRSDSLSGKSGDSAENDKSNFMSYVEDTEEQKKLKSMLKTANKQISDMEQATPAMNQVIN